MYWNWRVALLKQDHKCHRTESPPSWMPCTLNRQYMAPATETDIYDFTCKDGLSSISSIQVLANILCNVLQGNIVGIISFKFFVFISPCLQHISDVTHCLTHKVSYHTVGGKSSDVITEDPSQSVHPFISQWHFSISSTKLSFIQSEETVTCAILWQR